MALSDMFSFIEARDILISIVVLCIIFSYPEVITNPLFFVTSLLVVGVAFMGHELSHKFVAIRQGFWSEYRMWPQGLVMAVLLAFATGGALIFAAPGAVYFRSGLFSRSPGEKGLTKIAMAGISFNIALMWISLALYYFSGFAILAYMALINGWLAIFNLLPFGMLDGQKLFRLNRDIWALLLVLAVIGFILVQF
ncbi:MAG: site-2 protease family protein [Candidatus Aenigmatarchaeota archaeon]|nr:MAG: site-2 protease family protein [Candidatus Aenigmarchaeota archaeon]